MSLLARVCARHSSDRLASMPSDPDPQLSTAWISSVSPAYQASAAVPRGLHCPLCDYIVFDPVVGRCGHTVCGACSKFVGAECPRCKISPTEWRPNFSLRDALEGCAALRPAEDARRREQRADDIQRLCHDMRPCKLVYNSLPPADTCAALSCIRTFLRTNNARDLIAPGLLHLVTPERPMYMDHHQLYLCATTHNVCFVYLKL